MGVYVGLDVSLKQTSVCVIDEAGRVVWRGSCATCAGRSKAPPLAGLKRHLWPVERATPSR